MENISQTPISDALALEKIQKQQNRPCFLIPSLVLKLRYKIWLALLRETSILILLTKHYDEIPSKTPSKLLVKLFVKSSMMKNFLFAVEKRLRRKIY